MLQFIRFVCVGASNTIIDLGILNLLLAVFGIGTAGIAYATCKAVSFSVAVVNSYLWNKHWVFKKDASRISREGPRYEKGTFLLVSIFGLLVNVTVSSVIFAGTARVLPHVTHGILANMAAISGAIAVLAWNFVGYKYFVFGVRGYIRIRNNETQTFYLGGDTGLQRSKTDRSDA